MEARDRKAVVPGLIKPDVDQLLCFATGVYRTIEAYQSCGDSIEQFINETSCDGVVSAIDDQIRAAVAEKKRYPRLRRGKSCQCKLSWR